MAGTIDSIAQAIAGVAKIWYEWLKGAERRKMTTCIEAGEKYIQVSEREGEFKDITPKRQQDLLKHYRKRFYAHN